MKPTSKLERIASPKTPRETNSKPLLEIIAHPNFSEIKVKNTEASAYIEEMARELQAVAIAANHNVLAALLGAAAREASIQAARDTEMIEVPHDK